MIKIVSTAIDIEEVLHSILHPAAGGIDIFLGTTRNRSDNKNVLYLVYEAYEPMALKVMEGIAREARSRWTLEAVTMVHRIGRVDIGEASVAIGVSSAHRKEAFEACRFCIDALKADVPIWKREFFEDGTLEWAGTPSSR